ncbi:ribosome hibernation-promoting factor, HPF/YfiA family [Candidatus Soleaferrea massiliensis]|uniref:ribosome hibernation-promoting factor, HPF/YfiA family n=1 Tax=Candidatus Soleaferrea massiliensis TaxID=1470354 RepID=UPI00058E0230|nr:ribosome-associated translation inhibitor RaiA [Candidatus Soleaferrea massiliensis]
MNITYTARKVTLKDSFKERVERKLKKLDRFFSDDTTAVVIVSLEKDRQTVEITIKSHGMTFRAEKTTPDMFDSLEAVVDMLVKQIVKNKTKLSKRTHDNAFMKELEDYDVGEVEDSKEYKIVRNKKFYIKPMDEEEAILQMNILGHSFFMFRNVHTEEINVVYRRNDGNYGLLEPDGDIE